MPRINQCYFETFFFTWFRDLTKFYENWYNINNVIFQFNTNISDTVSLLRCLNIGFKTIYLMGGIKIIAIKTESRAEQSLRVTGI